MRENQTDNLYGSLTKALGYAAALVILLWMLHKIIGAVLILLFVIVLILILNAPIAALEKRRLSRGWACAIVFGTIGIGLVLLGWLIFPIISKQFTTLVNDLPLHATQLSKNISTWFSNYPEINKTIREETMNISQWLPNIPSTLQRIGNYSLSVLGTILLLILFFTMIIYGVSNPKPLAQLYFTFFPNEQREKAKEALMNTSIMLAGWMRSNFIAGTIRAVCVTVFLTLMKVPGAWIWGTLAFFSDLIPRIGFYIMAIPSLIAALSVNTTVAFWVLIFFLALDEIMGDFVIPRLRSKTMNLHPVSTLFILLAMGSAFGLMGLLLATPVAAIIKAYYEAFHIKGLPEDKLMDNRVDAVIHRVN